jgi:hypothetical protein
VTSSGTLVRGLPRYCWKIDFGIMPSTSGTIAWSDPSLAQTTKDILRHLKVLVAEGFEALLDTRLQRRFAGHGRNRVSHLKLLVPGQ